MIGVVIDSSAIVAILLEQASWRDLLAVVRDADERVMSAVSMVESAIVLENRSSVGAAGVDYFVADAHVLVVPFDERDARAAVEAWRRFGRGRHRAALNFGDCMTYALAARTGHPILCTGEDFAQTDLEVVPPR